MADLELEVAAVVEFGPLEFAVGGDECLRGEIGAGESDVLTVTGNVREIALSE